MASDAESLVEGFTGVMGDHTGEEVKDIGVGILVPFAVTTATALHTFVTFISQGVGTNISIGNIVKIHEKHA